MSLTTWYLEMTDPAALRPAPARASDWKLNPLRSPSPNVNRDLYVAVGGDWRWVDRLQWSVDRWRAYVDRPALETWVAHVHGATAGYFELEFQAGAQAEIAYFGLLPAFIGRGMGGWLLTRAIERAWVRGVDRVWVHTCSLDHPQALANYQARGLRLYKTEISPSDETAS